MPAAGGGSPGRGGGRGAHRWDRPVTDPKRGGVSPLRAPGSGPSGMVQQRGSAWPENPGGAAQSRPWGPRWGGPGLSPRFAALPTSRARAAAAALEEKSALKPVCVGLVGMVGPVKHPDSSGSWQVLTRKCRDRVLIETSVLLAA